MDSSVQNDEVRKEVIVAYHEVMNQLKLMNNGQSDENQIREEEENAIKATVIDLASKETVDELAKKLAELKEMTERRRNFENEKIQMEKERAREQSEYAQKRDTNRKRDQEQYEIDKRALYQELMENRRALEEDFEAREAGLAARENEHQQLKEREVRILAREQEYAQMKEKELRFPEELRNAVLKAETAIRETLTRESEYRTKLIQIESDSERNLMLQRISALEQQIEQYKTLKELFD
jgi:hypothetical protein